METARPMRLPAIAAIVAAAGLSSSACGPTNPSAPQAASDAPASLASVEPATAGPPGSPSVAPSAAIERNPAAFVEGEPYQVTIDPADFGAAIDNPFLPLTPGTTMKFDGAEQVVATVQPETKSILGVETTVVHDQVFADGELAEDTFDWYAQDRQGNVWYFGEKTAEYEDGAVTSTAGSWEAGVDGAQPGIIMLADPRAGDAYRQEYLAGEAEDLAQVTGIGGSLTVPFGAFDQVLVTEEWTPLEPDVRERKTYARGVGLLETRTIKGGDDVTQLTTVSPGG